MIISKIERQKKDKERYSLFVEDKFLIGVSEAILIHFALYKGQQISEDLLGEIKEAEYHHKVYNKAIRTMAAVTQATTAIIFSTKFKLCASSIKTACYRMTK